MADQQAKSEESEVQKTNAGENLKAKAMSPPAEGQKSWEEVSEEKEKYIQRLKEEHSIRVKSLETNINMLTAHNEQLSNQMKQLKSTLNPENLLPSFVKNMLPPPPSGKPPPGPPPGPAPAAKNRPTVQLKQLQEEKDLLKKDFDRLLEQLAKKEQDSTRFQDRAENLEAQLNMNKTALINANKELTAARKEADKREKDLKKLREDEVKNKNLQANQSQEVVKKYSEELISLREKMSLTTLERDTLKDELADVDSKISSAEKLKVEAEETLADYKNQYAALEASATMQEADFLDQAKKLQGEKEALEQERTKLHGKIETLDEALRKAQKEVGEQKSELRTLQEELEEQREMTDTARRHRDNLKEDLGRKLEESEQNQKITDRKRNNLVKELKSQLKKEAVAKRSLQAENAQLKSENQDLERDLVEVSGANSVQHSPNLSGPPTPNLLKRLSAPRGPAPRAPPPQRKTPLKLRGMNSSQSVHSEDGSEAAAQEVTFALSKKVREQEDKNHALKQQIKYLEQTVNDLNKELAGKKELVKNVMMRVDKRVALATHEHQQPAKRARNMQEQQELLNKMEIFVQETSLQNDHLRREKEVLGKEVQRLFKENAALKVGSSPRGRPPAKPAPPKKE